VQLVAYLRVSTDRQADHGLGLEVQEASCRAWASANGHRITTVYRDEGVSGANGIEDRDALPEVIADLEAGRADGVVIAALDRLARALHVQEAILTRVWASDAAVYVAGEGEVARDDPDDPMRTFVRQIMGAVAELDRRMIVKRLRAGRAAKAEQGGYAYGSPPLGFQAVDGELVSDPDEAPTLARIGELHDAGASLREMVRTLEAEGRPPKRGDRWHPESLRRIVARLDQAAA